MVRQDMTDRRAGVFLLHYRDNINQRILIYLTFLVATHRLAINLEKIH
jgi:hypothetical protein